MAKKCLLLLAAALFPGCGKPDVAPAADSAFAALQQRGQTAMGVDQYASAHVFEPLPDGGRIVLQMKETNAGEEKKIRDHMRTIAAAFASGDFSLPGFVHAGEVPGTTGMTRLRETISYTARDLERGGEVRVTTNHPDAVKAIHEFLAFQAADHHAGH
ncbi:MAG TPA: hypothetical protein VNO75_12570 [Gemmatimonadaceae bacterium]|nr:hypothetical protein [Gemmatimonadaceae bacterium]